MKKIFILFLSIIILTSFASAFNWNLNTTSYWDFNENTGTNAQNLVNGSLNLTLRSGITWNSTGVIGSMVQSTGGTGINNKLNITNNRFNNTGNSMTISFWYKPLRDSYAVNTYVLANENNFGFQQMAMDAVGAVPNINNTIQAYVAGNTFNGTANILGGPVLRPNNMYYVTFTMNSTNSKLYINGSVVNSSVGTYTISSAQFGLTLFNREDGALYNNGTIDELGIWNRMLSDSEVSELYNNGAGLAYGSTNGITINSPLSNSYSIQYPQPFNLSYSPISGNNLINISIRAYLGSTLSLTNYTTLTGNLSNTTIIYGNVNPGIYTIQGYGCESNSSGTIFCNVSSSNITLNHGIIFNNYSYNASTYETAYENYFSSISLSSVATISSIDFLFGSTEYSSSYSILGGGNYTLFGNLDIPSNFNSQNLSFNVTFSNGQAITSSAMPINIGQINFSLCSNIGSNLTYTNLSFKNETTSLQNINASISSTWTYRLGRGIVNKTYTFVNSSANGNYGFCFTPQNRSVIVDTTITYENTESPARTFGLSSTSLTNSSTLYTLYLLPSSLGIYTRYKTMTAGQQVITGAMATVQRTLGGSTFTVGSGFTDSSGQIAFFLDPSVSYDYTFSATSYGSSSFSLTPNSLETYTVILGSSTSSLNLGTDLGGSNLTYSVTPNGTQLANNTQYLFSFNVTGTDITFVSMNISNSTYSQLYYQSSSSSGLLSGLVNTGNNSRLYGYFTVTANNQTVQIVKVWDVGNYYAGSYSLYTQLRLWNQYGFSDFTRILLILIALTSIMVYISYNDIVESSESKVAVALLLIWAFSLVGWLDIGLASQNSSNSEVFNMLSNLANSYIIAIFSTIIGLGFIIRRLFQ